MNDEENYRAKFWRQRLGRRRLLKGAAVGGAGMAAVALVGCATQEGPQTRSAAAPTAVEPKRGGVVTRQGGPGGSLDLDGRGLDPHIQSGFAARGMRLFYQGLLAYDFRTFAIGPEIAQRWEQPSPTEYIFNLQPGVKWHNKAPADGRQLRAEDVVFSLERARTKDPRFTGRSLLENVDKIEAVDNSRLRITTKRPNVATLTNLAGDILLMVAPEVVEKAGKFATADTGVGTGAFMITALEVRVSNRYVRNPDYWKAGLPYLDEVRTRHISDKQAAYAAFLAGQMDIVSLPGTEVKSYIGRQGPNYTPDWYKNESQTPALPNTKVKPLDDRRVVKALRLLIDHDEFITAWADVLHGRGRHGAVFTTALEQWDLAPEEYKSLLEWKQPKDEAVREALALLSASGFTRDNPLRFELSVQTEESIKALGELLEAQWRRLGRGAVETRIKLVDSATAPAVRANRSFTYFVTGLSGSTSDPDSWFTELYRSGGAKNYSGFSDSRLDTMIDRQGTIFDVRERKALVKEISLYVIDQGMAIVVADVFSLNGVKPQIRNYVPENLLLGRQYERVWLDV